MKSNLKNLFGILLLAGAVSVTTGCPDEEKSCVTDADCEGAITCNTETNTCNTPTTDKTCMTSTDCDSGQSCLAATDGGDSTCGTAANCGAVITADQGDFCASALAAELMAGQTASCVADGDSFKCEADAAAQEAKYVRITDTTPSCDPDSEVGGTGGLRDPGSDIAIVEILQAGTPVGIAKYPGSGAYEPGATNPGYNKPEDVFDGEAEATGNRGCPAEVDQKYFRIDSAVSLGCGGSLTLGFQNSAGTEVNLINGNDIKVVELGQYCEEKNDVTATGTDRYRVNICLTEAGAAFSSIDLDASCSTALSGAAEEGISSIVVSGAPEAASTDS